MPNTEKHYEKGVMVVEIFSYLNYYLYSDFKDCIRSAKYPQWQIISDYMITVTFTTGKAKIQLSLLSFNTL